MKDLKFNVSCMKMHDCHANMTQLLPIAIKGGLLGSVDSPLKAKFESYINKEVCIV